VSVSADVRLLTGACFERHQRISAASVGQNQPGKGRYYVFISAQRRSVNLKKKARQDSLCKSQQTPATRHAYIGEGGQRTQNLMNSRETDRLSPHLQDKRIADL